MKYALQRTAYHAAWLTASTGVPCAALEPEAGAAAHSGTGTPAAAFESPRLALDIRPT